MFIMAIAYLSIMDRAFVGSACASLPISLHRQVDYDFFSEKLEHW